MATWKRQRGRQGISTTHLRHVLGARALRCSRACHRVSRRSCYSTLPYCEYTTYFTVVKCVIGNHRGSRLAIPSRRGARPHDRACQMAQPPRRSYNAGPPSQVGGNVRCPACAPRATGGPYRAIFERFCYTFVTHGLFRQGNRLLTYCFTYIN